MRVLKFVSLPVLFLSAFFASCSHDKKDADENTSSPIVCGEDFNCIYSSVEINPMLKDVDLYGVKYSGNESGSNEPDEPCYREGDVCSHFAGSDFLIWGTLISDPETIKYDCSARDNLFPLSSRKLKLSVSNVSGRTFVEGNLEVYTFQEWTNSLVMGRDYAVSVIEHNGRLIATSIFIASQGERDELAGCSQNMSVYQVLSIFPDCQINGTSSVEQFKHRLDEEGPPCLEITVEEESQEENE